MTIDQAYRFCQYVANKTQNGNITPVQFNMLAPIMQISVINDLIGNEKQYRPHDPLPLYGYNINDKVRTDLLNLIVKPTTIPVTAGVASYPTDLLYIDTQVVSSTGRLITEATSDEIAILNNSVIKPPTAQFPKYVMYSDGIYVYPASLTSIKLSYLRRPAVPVWNYTIVNDAPVYNSSGSQDFELFELIHIRICAKILQAVGINLSALEVSQYAAAMEVAGA